MPLNRSDSTPLSAKGKGDSRNIIAKMLRSTLVIRSYFTTKLGLSLYFQYFSLSHFKNLLPVSSKFLINIKTKNCKTLIYSKCMYTYFYGPMNIWDVYSDLHNFEKKWKFTILEYHFILQFVGFTILIVFCSHTWFDPLDMFLSPRLTAKTFA